MKKSPTGPIRILIIGAGNIGIMVSNLLAKKPTFAGREVQIYLKARSNFDQLTQFGALLKLKDDPEGQFYNITNKIRIVKNYASLNTAIVDYVIITTKGYDLTNVLDELKLNSINPECFYTPINGLGIEKIIIDKFPHSEVIAGSITLPVELVNPWTALITNTHKGIALSYAMQKGKNLLANLKIMFENSGFETLVCDDHRAMRLTKLFLNISCNALAAILGKTPKEIYSNSKFAEIEFDAQVEAYQLIKRLDKKFIALPGYSIKNFNLMEQMFGNNHIPRFIRFAIFRFVYGAKVAASRGGKPGSIHCDLLKANSQTPISTEIDQYNGAIVQAAKEIDLRVPVNTAITVALKEVTQNVFANPYPSGQKDLYKQIYG